MLRSHAPYMHLRGRETVTQFVTLTVRYIRLLNARAVPAIATQYIYDERWYHVSAVIARPTQTQVREEAERLKHRLAMG